MPYLSQHTPQPEPLDCRVLNAALDLFVERGFHSVSIHDVQKRAGVSIGTIYNYFGGKEGVATALYDHLLGEFEIMVAAVREQDALTAQQQCNQIIRLLFQYTESRRSIIAYMLHARHREFLPSASPVCASTSFQAMRQIVQQGMATGEIRQGNLMVMTALIFGGAIQLIQQRLDGVIKTPLMHHYDDLIASIWAGAGASHQPDEVNITQAV